MGFLFVWLLRGFTKNRYDESGEEPNRLPWAKVGRLAGENYWVAISILGAAVGIYGLVITVDSLMHGKRSLPAKNQASPIPYALKHVDRQLAVFDAQMTRQNSISMTSDQRQTWIVSGRIKNTTEWFVDTVWIEIHVTDKKTGDELDSTVVKMDNLRIPPRDGVVAFSQSARINPPATGWAWTYEVINSLTEPVYGDVEQ